MAFDLSWPGESKLLFFLHVQLYACCPFSTGADALVVRKVLTVLQTEAKEKGKKIYPL